MRSMWMACVAAVVLGAGLPGPLAGQVPPAAGDRVRVHEADGRSVTGILAVAPEDEVRLFTSSGQEVVLPVERVSALERSLGSRRRFGRNFGMTVGIAAVGLGTISAITWQPCRDTGFLACFLVPESRTEAFAWGFAGGGIIGLPLGLIIGLAVKTESWEEVSLRGPGGLELSLRPVFGAGAGLVVAFPFGGASRRGAARP